MKVAWLAPYPVQRLKDRLHEPSLPAVYHPCSWIVNLSEALARQPDVELHLISENTRLTRDHSLQHGNITFHLVKTGMPIIHRGYPVWFPIPVLNRFRFIAHRLADVVKRIQPDIVHSHGTEGPYTRAALESGFPVLVSMQGIVGELFKLTPCFRFRVVRELERDQVQRARFFTCRTEFDTAYVTQLNPQARIFNIPEAMNPVFFDRLWSLPPEPRVLYVGALMPAKGIGCLLYALAEVRREIPDVSLELIGSGAPAYLAELKQLSQQLRIDDCVHFVGQRSAQEIAARHQQSQIFVLPSTNENSPNSLAEAMVSGMPVIATRVGGIPTMIKDGESGLLVAPQKPAELAAKIRFLLAEPSQRRKLGAQAAIDARARHWPEHVAVKTMSAYREVMGFRA